MPYGLGYHTGRWKDLFDLRFSCQLDRLGVSVLARSMLVNCRRLGSFCSGLGTDSFVMEHLIKPAVARSALGLTYGKMVQLRNVSSCA